MTRLALNTVNRFQYSETFIKDHFEGVEAESKHFLHGGYMPIYADDALMLNNPIAKLQPKSIFYLFKNANQKAIGQYLKDQDINVVLSEYGPCGVEMTDICKDAGVKHIVWFHGYDVSRQDMVDEYLERYKKVFQTASALIGVSKEMISTLKKWGAPGEKLHHIPCGGNPEFFKPSGQQITEPVFLSVGRFSETKAPDLAIKAFAIAQKEMPNAQLRMAGKGELLDDCKALVRELGLEQNVNFLGVIPREKVAEEMQNCLAFVQHSRTTQMNEKEGTPVAVSEAGLCAKPVISTYHAGIPDVVLHDETGMLVEEGDFETMGKYMIQLGKEPGKAQKLGQHAFQRCKTEFSLKQSIDKLNALVNSLTFG